MITYSRVKLLLLLPVSMVMLSCILPTSKHSESEVTREMGVPYETALELVSSVLRDMEVGIQHMDQANGVIRGIILPRQNASIVRKWRNSLGGEIRVNIKIVSLTKDNTKVQFSAEAESTFMPNLELHRVEQEFVDGLRSQMRKRPHVLASSRSQEGTEVDIVPANHTLTNPKAYALVIGIEEYRGNLPKADFADRDAKLVSEYLTKALGYPEENVVVRTNENATKNDLEKYLEGWLPNNVEQESSVFVYYSGHDTPNLKNGDAYLVPYDGDPAFVDKTGYSLKRLYAALDKLPAKDITVVLDSCFSGGGGRSVLAEGARPMVLSVENTLIASGRTVVLAASSGNQISSTLKDQGHGLLTYYFLKGLQGDGDLDHDGSIDLVELYEYVKPNVQRVARKQYNNEQTPQLLGSSEMLKRSVVLVRSR